MQLFVCQTSPTTLLLHGRAHRRAGRRLQPRCHYIDRIMAEQKGAGSRLALVAGLLTVFTAPITIITWTESWGRAPAESSPPQHVPERGSVGIAESSGLPAGPASGGATARAIEKTHGSGIRPERSYTNAGVVSELKSRGGFTVLVSGDRASERRIWTSLRTSGVDVHTGLFTPAALQDGVVDRIRNGDTALLDELGLARVRGNLVFIDLHVGESVDTGALFRTLAELSATIVPLDGGGPTHLWLEERGAGFDPESADRQAEGRVVEQLALHLRDLPGGR